MLTVAMANLNRRTSCQGTMTEPSTRELIQQASDGIERKIRPLHDKMKITIARSFDESPEKWVELFVYLQEQTRSGILLGADIRSLTMKLADVVNEIDQDLKTLKQLQNIKTSVKD